jgi:DNA-binding response OmpR family regulator
MRAPRVLVVSRERDTRMRLTKGFASGKFRVLHLEDCVQAASLLETGTISGVVIEGIHPECESYVGQLRAADQVVPILLLANPSDPDDHARALNAGADIYLAKPFSFLVLMAHLRALIRSSERAGDISAQGTSRVNHL